MTADYILPVRKSTEGMYRELLGYVNQIRKYLPASGGEIIIFVNDETVHQGIQTLAKAVHPAVRGRTAGATLSVVDSWSTWW